MEPPETDDATTLDALERLVRRADGFALAFARVNSLPRRRELAADLRQRLDGAVRVVEVDVPPETTDLQAVLARVYEEAEGDGKLALFVYGIGRVLSSVRERTGFLPVLNYKRENLQRSVPVPVVLWMPEFALRLIARGAPDTWAWRSGVFEFATPPEETDRTWGDLQGSGTVDEYARMTPVERRERSETLEALYCDYAERSDLDEATRTVIQAEVADRLARLYSATADSDAELNWARQSLGGFERALGLDHPATLRSVNNLGVSLGRRGDFDGAERLCRRALDGFERVFGPDHPRTLASVANLGNVLENRGDLAGAERLCRRALDGFERVFGPDHPRTLGAAANYGNMLKKRGDLAGAERLHRWVLENAERVLGPDHPDTLGSASNLGNVLWKRGDFGGAERLYRRALDGFERVFGPDHPDTLSSTNNLGLLLRVCGDLDSAEQLHRRALEGAERFLGLGHPNTRSYRQNLGALLAQRHPAPE